jgi:hypothetical protein
MTVPRKLTLFTLTLAAVFALSTALGKAVDPVGLSNAEPAKAEHGGGMDAAAMVRGLAAAEDGQRFVPETDTVAAGQPTQYRFRVDGEKGVVREFDVEHTKRMHVIVVRRDFAGFQHLHPEMGADGTWSTPLTITDPGMYRVFADYVVDGEKHTLATDLFVPGDFRPRPVPAPQPQADAGDGDTVELLGEPTAGEETTLQFVVRHDGAVVDDLSEYLGARGHLVVLRDGDLAYLHVHPDEDRLSFDAEFPTPGTYRLFLQFRHDGEVRTAAFTVAIEEGSR